MSSVSRPLGTKSRAVATASSMSNRHPITTLGQTVIAVSIYDFATLWGDLVGAYYRQGDKERSDTVTLPTFRIDGMSVAESLLSLSVEFSKRYRCELRFDGKPFSNYLADRGQSSKPSEVDVTVVLPADTPAAATSPASQPPAEPSSDLLPESPVMPISDDENTAVKADKRTQNKEKASSKGYSQPQQSKPRFFSRISDSEMLGILDAVIATDKQSKRHKEVKMSKEMFDRLKLLAIEMDAIRGSLISVIVASPTHPLED